MIGGVQPNRSDSMIAQTTVLSTRITRVWPTGSNRRARAGLGHEQCGAHDRGGHDRHVDPEDGVPAQALDQGAAEDRTQSQRQAGHRAEHADGPGPLSRVGERGGDDRHRHGLSIVPPAACSARAAISQPILGARPHISEPRPKTARPTWKTRRRPTRSSVDPASTRKLARHGNEQERLALMEAHRADVTAKLAERQENLKLIDHKIDVYRGRLAAGDADQLWAPNRQAP